MGRIGAKPLRGQQRRKVAAELAAQFIQGTTSIPELAASTGRRPSLIRRLLAEAGVRTDGPECVGTDPDDTARIVRDCYRGSGSIQAVVETTSLDRRVVRHLLALPAQSGDQFDSETVAEMARRYRAGATLQKIASETGRSYNQVRAALLDAGVSLRPPGGPPGIDPMARSVRADAVLDRRPACPIGGHTGGLDRRGGVPAVACA
jgi:Helix-turn-helix domain